MDVLAVDSAVDITCEHGEFNAKMLSLKTDAAAVGSVEVGVTVWCVWTVLAAYVCACLHVVYTVSVCHYFIVCCS